MWNTVAEQWSRWLRRALLAAIAVVCVAVLGWHVFALGRWALFSARLDAAAAAPVTGQPEARSWSFGFDRGWHRVSVDVYPSELEQAAGLDTADVFSGPAFLRERYVGALLRTSAESRLVGQLAEQLREVRDRRDLDDDEYIQLMAAAVQAIPYGSVDRRVMLPAEVVAAGEGVCTEKSVLLGALLVREGYDTAVIVLDAHDHVALGVASDTMTYRELPYAFVETTRVALVGECDPSYRAWGPVWAPPQVIELGGEKRFAGGA